MKFKKAFKKAALATLVGGAIVTAVSGCGYYDESVVRATVTDKAIMPQSDGNGNVTSTYMIYTDQGTFRDDDALFSKGKMNSSDVYGAIQKGCTYDFNVYGMRNHFLSSYKNIDNATLVSCPKTGPVNG